MLIRCILSKFYIKPQHWLDHRCSRSVVSYRNSTSNHNEEGGQLFGSGVVSYRNSTSNHNNTASKHTEIPVVSYRNSTSNHNGENYLNTDEAVVSYRNSTSNHNGKQMLNNQTQVVSYRNSTSNHNRLSVPQSLLRLYLIEILHQTTTTPFSGLRRLKLYLIEILHQTTTGGTTLIPMKRCILSKFYIKPQLIITLLR